MDQLLIGQTLRYSDDPFQAGISAAHHSARGGVVLRDGLIVAVGEADELRSAHPGAQVHDYGAGLISAGFIDAHVHYPQTAIIASWGKRLIDWLNTYTFPEEMRFADPAHATDIAGRYLDLALSMAPPRWPATARSTPKAWMRSLRRRRRAACGRWRARPAWTATRPTVCAIRRSPPMTTASACWRNGTGSTGCPTSSPRAFRPPRRPNNSAPWARFGPKIPIA